MYLLSGKLIPFLTKPNILSSKTFTSQTIINLIQGNQGMALPCDALHLCYSCASRQGRLDQFTAHADVYIVDPRTVLSSNKPAKLSSVQLEIPQALLNEPPRFELGDADDPMSTWIFGERAEIFQYKFLGGGGLHTDSTEHTLMHSDSV